MLIAAKCASNGVRVFIARNVNLAIPEIHASGKFGTRRRAKLAKS